MLYHDKQPLANALMLGFEQQETHQKARLQAEVQKR